jgi:hypothetical protein
MTGNKKNNKFNKLQRIKGGIEPDEYQQEQWPMLKVLMNARAQSSGELEICSAETMRQTQEKPESETLSES